MGKFLLLFASLLSILVAANAIAPSNAAANAESAPVTTEQVEARLVAGSAKVRPGETLTVALALKIKDHWHTYWRFPGDSGAPTSITWDLPDGFSNGEILWPIGKRFDLGPLTNYAYDGEALHLVEIAVPAALPPGAPIELKADAEWLVCSDEVCIPEWGSFLLTLEAAGPGETPRPDAHWAPRIAAARAAMPLPAPFKVHYALEGEQVTLAVTSPELAKSLGAGSFSKAEFFPYTDGLVVHSGAQTLLSSADGAALEMPAGYALIEGRVTRLEGVLVLTLDGERQGFEIAAEKGAMPLGLGAAPRASLEGGNGPGGGIAGLAGALLFALAGGIILNLMPCVFPVLSMKALNFAGKAHLERRAIRRQGWAFTAGVLLSFLLLALGLFLLRMGGAEIGWGYQLQSPVVILLLAYLMFAVGLMLAGPLTIGAGLAGIGDRFTRLPGSAGAFFTGVLATLVATPCTAPFMGAALGYAMMASLPAGLLIFLALGFGLALPYLLLSHYPGFLALLPKPGPWMDRFKELLAFPMFATAAWLVWVLAQQAGANGVLAALTGMILIALAAWLFKQTASGLGPRIVARGLAVLSLASAVGLASFATNAAAPSVAEPGKSAEGLVWEAYSEARLDEARAAGRAVFVDFTAAWCITCKINEMGVLAAPATVAAFKAKDVLLLRGDWTSRDAAITEKLAEFGRAGVPLYLFYPPGQEARILPQILRVEDVISALGEIEGS